MRKEGTASQCPQCRAMFYRSPSQRGSFCSKPCWYAFRSAKPSTLPQRFRSGVDTSGGGDACHNWMKSCVGTGYGAIRERGVTIRCNRLAYELAHGVVLTTEQHVLHSCDNPRCCNPKHLFLGTPKTNSDDKIAKGRNVSGERHHAYRFSKADKAAMAALRASGRSVRYIAALFKCSEGYVSAVCSAERQVHMTSTVP